MNQIGSVSPNGGSADVGATTTSVGDFGMLLGTFSSDSATGWIGLSYSLLGLGSLMLGLVFVVPMLGHASWHAYRDTVDASGLVARASI